MKEEIYRHLFVVYQSPYLDKYCLLDQNAISSHISRGCSATYSSADRCYFSRSPDLNQPDMVEYTCTSSCDRDGCNTYLRE